MTSDTNNSEITFEDLMGQLENCVEQLEKGGISLEGAAEIYEKGMTIQEKYEQAIEGGLETEGLDVKEL